MLAVGIDAPVPQKEAQYLLPRAPQRLHRRLPGATKIAHGFMRVIGNPHLFVSESMRKCGVIPLSRPGWRGPNAFVIRSVRRQPNTSSCSSITSRSTNRSRGGQEVSRLSSSAAGAANGLDEIVVEPGLLPIGGDVVPSPAAQRREHDVLPSGKALIRRPTLQPSMPGMPRSTKMMSGLNSGTAAMANPPS